MASSRDTHRNKDMASNRAIRLNSKDTDRGLIVTLPRNPLRLLDPFTSSRTHLLVWVRKCRLMRKYRFKEEP